MKLLGAFQSYPYFLGSKSRSNCFLCGTKRLFDAVEGWGEYDTTKLSQGGGIYLRSSKSIPLSPEVQKDAWGSKRRITSRSCDSIVAQIKCRSFWNGGIGTYVKSSLESDQDAGDPSNDILRINANELRAQMIGEGGKFGIHTKGSYRVCTTRRTPK